MEGNSAPATVPIIGEPPVARDGKFIPICRAKPGSKVFGVSLNQSVLGVQCHYLDGRTFPCTVRGGPCEGCLAGNRTRWQGYLPIMLPHAGRVGLAEITHQAAADCPTLNQVGRSLRGLWIILERLGTSKRSRVSCTFEEKPLTFQLPKPIDTAAALERLWGTFAWVQGRLVYGPDGNGRADQ